MDAINLTNSRGSIVYVIYAVKGDDKIAFYVGESGRGIARIADYINASFGAATDFKVGRTVRMLEEKGYEVIVEIEKTPNRKVREKELIEKYSDQPLLNHVASYDYKITGQGEYLSILEGYVRENFAT